MIDQQIWSKIVESDVSALSILHDKYYYQLWLYARQITKDESIADELVSDCFIAIWNNRHKIIIEKSLKAYLVLMVRNRAVSFLRKTKTNILVDPKTIPDLEDEPELKNQEFYAELYKAIEKLPSQRRRILELAAFESLSYKEIANKLDISINTVKTQMGRAYQFLKEELDPKNFILFSLIQSRNN